MIHDNHQRWFAVQTRPRFEKAAFQLLHQKGYDLVLPLCRSRRQWKHRSAVVSTPLFPGYLFCRMNPNHRLPVLTTPGVVRILSAGKAPAPLDDSEVLSIRTLVASGLPPRPCPFLRAGELVEIPAGPLRGVRGTVVGLKGDCRLVVSVTLLQRSVAVEIDNSWIGGLHLHTVKPDSDDISAGARPELPPFQGGLSAVGRPSSIDRVAAPGRY
jgi:transcription antitermination factor NusG